MGVVCGAAGLPKQATILLALSAVTFGFALHLTQRPHGQPKVQGIHPSFPTFIRLAYSWLVIAGLMSIWAAFADQHGGIWGASRHALTVGFAATMVFSIGPRILPHFGGVHGVFSKRLMFLSLLFLQTGCLLRVSSEPLAYEGCFLLRGRCCPSLETGVDRSASYRNQSCTHLSPRPLRVCRRPSEIRALTHQISK